jgi:hypothetical protein
MKIGNKEIPHLTYREDLETARSERQSGEVIVKDDNGDYFIVSERDYNDHLHAMDYERVDG